ncbi:MULTISPECIES: carbohydrate ABC transporter permease [unclassified Paenibacillus]|uniref:carbohydrate ABC transporter permease n=1 Tax=unclassified Paenibacillus TaxID=185978 RepID=UPI001C11B76E|nr:MULTISPECIES: carbohydrate ABC transporter permease [unclassified Paenibacillus]MBU5445112.1 carbohydrate ABC transporter permease [Paenibacillus sp. MSJ-34]CAH0122745.1 Inner membrane ABC transporter permease protein YcjP [Paenibacillus sp. CECT 9249]
MLYRKTWSYKLFMLFNGAFMLIVVGAIVLPFLHILSVSFSDSAAIVGGRVGLFPQGFNVNSYIKLFAFPDILSGFRNSVIQTALGTLIGLFMLTVCAYPLSKRALKGRKTLILFIMFTMFFSGGLIPTYMLVRSLGLIDSIWAIVIPFCITPYYLILMMTYFQGIPADVEESAMIDGLNPIQILYRIILPLAKPVMAAISLFLIVYYWNNWFNSMIYLNSTDKYPIMLIVRNIIVGSDIASQGGTVIEDSLRSTSAAALKSTAIIITALPIIAVFPFAQKHFVAGVMLGSVKG